MNGKKARAIRKALRSSTTTDTSKQYKFITTPVTMPYGVRYNFTYVASGDQATYKMAKKIYKMFGVLPRENINATKTVAS